MISLKAKAVFHGKAILKKVEEATVKSLGHAGALVRLIARRSIKRSPVKSAEGTPPHTRRGLLRGAILYAQEKGRVIIGPSARIAGPAGKPHEFGGKFRAERYPKRPFMGPALQKAADRLPKFWKKSVR
ncbi:MAG: hypothetical protein AB7F75_01260 [Planctomycetota bacterium]